MTLSLPSLDLSAFRPAGVLIAVGIAVALMSFQLLLTCSVLGVRAAMRRIATALERHALDDAPADLPEAGPPTVARVARAINASRHHQRERIAEHLDVQAAFAHDLRTPLTRMRLRCELLAASAPLDAMERDLEEMESLVEGSIASARTLRGVAQTQRPVDVDALIAALVRSYREAGHAVALEGHAGRAVMACPLALRRVIGNLVDNALRHAGDAALCVHLRQEQLVLAVRDSGPGIEPGDLEQVFAPWYRAPGGLARSNGSGLGLAIARRLAVAMHCDLQLENRRGGGLEARLILPLVRD